jgi:hypothetical protein
MHIVRCTDHLGNVFASQDDMCKYWNIKQPTFLARTRSGWSLERALTTQSGKKKVKDHLGNEYNSFIDMCLKYGKSPDTVNYRVKAGWDLMSALTADVDKSRSCIGNTCKDHLGREFGSTSEMCAAYNITKSLFNYRMNSGMTLEAALTLPVDHR